MEPSSRAKPVGVLTKMFQIVKTLGQASAPLPLRELSRLTRVHPSTAYRVLAHLGRHGWIERDQHRGYLLGRNLKQALHPTAREVKLREISRPFFWGLWKYTGETVNLAVLDGAEVVYLDALESAHDLRIVTNIGMHAVFYRTALGKAIAAYLRAQQRQRLLSAVELQAFTPKTVCTREALEKDLEQTRRRGYAVDDEESHLGVRCLGAPILNAAGESVAALSISGPTSRITLDRIADFGNAVHEAAREISAILNASDRTEVEIPAPSRE